MCPKPTICIISSQFKVISSPNLNISLSGTRLLKLWYTYASSACLMPTICFQTDYQFSSKCLPTICIKDFGPNPDVAVSTTRTYIESKVGISKLCPKGDTLKASILLMRTQLRLLSYIFDCFQTTNINLNSRLRGKQTPV